jgi:hypothetical protein
MIDGANFAARRISELAADPDFVSAVVLRASVHLPRGAVDDHLLSAFLEGHGPGRLAAVVDAIPSQLSQLVEYGLWTPRDSAEWGVILDEIERQRVEALTPELLRVAEGLPEHGWKARALASRAQRVDLETIARFQIADLAPEDRIEACQALGASDDAAAREMLGGLDQDPDPRVRAAALVARLRLGDRTAAASVEKIVADRTEPDHAAVLESLGRNAREGPIAARLEETMRRAPAADLATVAAALTAQTRSSGRATARSLFALDAPPTGERRYLLVARAVAPADDAGHRGVHRPLPAAGRDGAEPRARVVAGRPVRARRATDPARGAVEGGVRRERAGRVPAGPGERLARADRGDPAPAARGHQRRRAPGRVRPRRMGGSRRLGGPARRDGVRGRARDAGRAPGCLGVPDAVD